LSKEGELQLSTGKTLWNKFAASKKYREEFVAAQVKRGIPFQIRSLLRNRGMSQEELAEASGLTQGAISRAANPNYGNLTLNTIIRIAAGFDVAFIGTFVPFSVLEQWFSGLDEKAFKIPKFTEEDERQKESVGRNPKQVLGLGLADQVLRNQSGALRKPPMTAVLGRMSARGNSIAGFTGLGAGTNEAGGVINGQR
jgi:transcriptional regulator with XRE-family HTH domain